MIARRNEFSHFYERKSITISLLHSLRIPYSIFRDPSIFLIRYEVFRGINVKKFKFHKMKRNVRLRQRVSQIANVPLYIRLQRK